MRRRVFRLPRRSADGPVSSSTKEGRRVCWRGDPGNRFSPTCAESRVRCRQINALVEKSSLHFLQSYDGPLFFRRESHFVNENHARSDASIPKVVTTRSNRHRRPLNLFIRLTPRLAKFRKQPTNCASW